MQLAQCPNDCRTTLRSDEPHARYSELSNVSNYTFLFITRCCDGYGGIAENTLLITTKPRIRPFPLQQKIASSISFTHGIFCFPFQNVAHPVFPRSARHSRS